MEKIKTISIVGAGNVATHLARVFYQNGLTIKNIYSSHLENAILLASKVGAIPCNSVQDITPDVDLVIIAVKDDALASVIHHLPKGIQSVVQLKHKVYNH